MKRSVTIIGDGKIPDSDYRGIRVVGSAKLYGGTAKSVRVAGSAEFLDDMEIRELKFAGALEAKNATLTCGRATLRGEGQFKLLRCDTLRIKKHQGIGDSGYRPTISGRVEAKRAEITGTATIEELQAEELVLEGSLTSKKPLICERIVVKGGALAAEETECERIEGKLSPKSCLGEVHATSALLGCSDAEKRFRAELIEADDIELESAEVDVVRGLWVRIGRGCKVRLVEYRQTASIDDGAFVETRTFTGKGKDA